MGEKVFDKVCVKPHIVTDLGTFAGYPFIGINGYHIITDNYPFDARHFQLVEKPQEKSFEELLEKAKGLVGKRVRHRADEFIVGECKAFVSKGVEGASLLVGGYIDNRGWCVAVIGHGLYGFSVPVDDVVEIDEEAEKQKAFDLFIESIEHGDIVEWTIPSGAVSYIYMFVSWDAIGGCDKGFGYQLLARGVLTPIRDNVASVFKERKFKDGVWKNVTKGVKSI